MQGVQELHASCLQEQQHRLIALTLRREGATRLQLGLGQAKEKCKQDVQGLCQLLQTSVPRKLGSCMFDNACSARERRGLVRP